jgi:hypothetical protein
MSRLSTVKTTTIRVILAATIVTSAAPLPGYAQIGDPEALTNTDAPALPSSFYGTAAAAVGAAG